MIRKYLKNSFYLFMSGGIAFAILKDEKIIDYSANLIEQYSSKFIYNPNSSQTIDEEKSYLKLFVILQKFYIDFIFVII